MKCIKVGTKYAREIKRYKEITGDAKNFYLSEKPCIYEDMSGNIFACDLSQIIDLPSDAKKAVGGLYRI